MTRRISEQVLETIDLICHWRVILRLIRVSILIRVLCVLRLFMAIDQQIVVPEHSPREVESSKRPSHRGESHLESISCGPSSCAHPPPHPQCSLHLEIWRFKECKVSCAKPLDSKRRIGDLLKEPEWVANFWTIDTRSCAINLRDTLLHSRLSFSPSKTSLWYVDSCKCVLFVLHYEHVILFIEWSTS